MNLKPAEVKHGCLFHYLRTAIRNGVRDILRRHARMRNYDASPMSSTGESTPEQLAERSEFGQRLRQCLLSLPVEQREVLLWRAYQGLQFEEIARRQGICSSTARGRYRYGIGKLGSLMHSSA
ncbi:RNA polymerase sigma factor [Planctomycetota bacterium]